MPEFTYEAIDKSGTTSTGTIVARDSADIRAVVRPETPCSTPFTRPAHVRTTASAVGLNGRRWGLAQRVDASAGIGVFERQADG